MAQGVALSWWMLQTTGDAVWLSVLTLCTMGPTLVAGAWAGAVVDRSDRRRLLIVTQLVLMGVAAALTVLAATGTLAVWNVLAASVVAGAALATNRTRVRGAARDGIRYAFRSPVIRALLPMSAASGLICI